MVPTPTPYTPCVVDRPMNRHGALTLSEVTGTRTYQVVEYATAEVREALARTANGSTVRIWLEPLNSRGDAWKAVDVENEPTQSHTVSNVVEESIKRCEVHHKK